MSGSAYHSLAEREKERLIETHKVTVDRVVRKFSRHAYTWGLEQGDLQTIARLALLKAQEKFEPSKTTVLFSAYAYRCMVNGVINALRAAKVQQSHGAPVLRGKRDTILSEIEADFEFLAGSEDEPGFSEVEASAIIDRFKGRLKDEEITVLRMFSEGLQPSDVRRILEKPKATMHFFMRRLREKIDKDFQHEKSEIERIEKESRIVSEITKVRPLIKVNPEPKEKNMLTELIEKLPSYDPTWSQEIMLKWFECFTIICNLMSEEIKAA